MVASRALSDILMQWQQISDDIKQQVQQSKWLTPTNGDNAYGTEYNA